MRNKFKDIEDVYDSICFLGIRDARKLANEHFKGEVEITISSHNSCGLSYQPHRLDGIEIESGVLRLSYTRGGDREYRKVFNSQAREEESFLDIFFMSLLLSPLVAMDLFNFTVSYIRDMDLEDILIGENNYGINQ